MAPSNNNNNNNIYYHATLLLLLGWVLRSAYQIRLRAIHDYGPVIHEFDPYFNFRATEYLYYNGYQRFFAWFDHKVWYPLGRPVGTTIYPGMQFTAVYLKRYIFGDSMSLNDVCCYIPAWFGTFATLLTGCMAVVCMQKGDVKGSGQVWNVQRALQWLLGTNTNRNRRHTYPYLSGVIAAGGMAIVPAHLMRSMGGGFDNESVAVSAMLLVFLLWMTCLQSRHTSVAVLCGVAYWYMVAAWGGYVFCINVIAVHAAVLGAVCFSSHVYWRYTLFYITGTFLATRVPVVGLAPLKSLEQVSALLVFGVYQVFMVVQVAYKVEERRREGRPLGFWTVWRLRLQFLLVAAVALFLLGSLFLPEHYFGPLSSRVRGLFVQHTKTGNPLVDSVAEHQPANSRAYFVYLHHVCSLAPIGFIYVMTQHVTYSSSFLLVWGTAAYFFSHKMVRLVLLTAPIASILAGIATAQLLSWAVGQWVDTTSSSDENGATPTTKEEEPTTTQNTKGNARKAAAQRRKTPSRRTTSNNQNSTLASIQAHWDAFATSPEGILLQRISAALLLSAAYLMAHVFIGYCWKMSFDLSNPSILMKARLKDGSIITVDDYREAYWWIRDHTPKDARIMAWWDYGYQISAIANRTTIADGNTWNHEHIALLGKALTTDLDQGYEIARHLADYVLIWAGGGGDDLAKSPHLARIANSVYRDHCPDDPTCRAFGFIDRQGTPSAMMRRSFLYNLHGHGLKPDVTVPSTQFKEVHRSKYGKVRIFQIMGVDESSKAWVPEHYQCDAPGSWFCPGQYPPGLQAILQQKQDFRQLEDFNKRKGDGSDEDDEYQKKYFENLQNPEVAKLRALEKEKELLLQQAASAAASSDSSGGGRQQSEELKRKQQHLYTTWEDSEESTRMWQLIKDNNIQELQQWLSYAPEMAFVRSKDGRGPMFWAHEQRNEAITKLLLQAGVPNTDTDAHGKTPVGLLE